jgi:hypothetical protein
MFVVEYSVFGSRDGRYDPSGSSEFPMTVVAAITL